MAGYIERVGDAVAAILTREGLDYAQTKAVFKAARQRAGLEPPKEKRGAPARLSLEEELRFIDQAYAKQRLPQQAICRGWPSLELGSPCFR